MGLGLYGTTVAGLDFNIIETGVCRLRYALDAFGLIGCCFDPVVHIDLLDLLDLNIALDQNCVHSRARLQWNSFIRFFSGSIFPLEIIAITTSLRSLSTAICTKLLIFSQLKLLKQFKKLSF